MKSLPNVTHTENSVSRCMEEQMSRNHRQASEKSGVIMDCYTPYILLEIDWFWQLWASKCILHSHTSRTTSLRLRSVNLAEEFWLPDPFFRSPLPDLAANITNVDLQFFAIVKGIPMIYKEVLTDWVSTPQSCLLRYDS